MEIREQVIYIGKKMIADGLAAATWGNISVKDQGKIFITPSGMDYQSLAPEDIVAVDEHGIILEGLRKPSSEMLLHLEIYRHRADVLAIVHTHSLYASAYAAARKSIEPLIEDMAQVIGGTVEVAQYALPGSKELALNTVAALGNKGAALLANHGVVGVGNTLAEAYKACLLVEKTAHIGIAAQGLGGYYVLSQTDVDQMRNMYINYYGQK
ncbi:MAG: class II aldolase/adducin family protein [Bacillota bacterium]